MKNIIFAMLAMVLSATAFAAPSSSASWTPFSGAPTFERHTDTDLTELPVGAMLAMVTAVEDCKEDFDAHLAGVTNAKAADSPPMVLWCQEPPPTYDACMATARANFDAFDALLRSNFSMWIMTAKATANGAANTAGKVRDECLSACPAGEPGKNCRTQCEGIYCNSLGFALDDFDTTADAAEAAYIAARGANHQAYVYAQAACCDG